MTFDFKELLHVHKVSVLDCKLSERSLFGTGLVYILDVKTSAGPEQPIVAKMSRRWPQKLR